MTTAPNVKIEDGEAFKVERETEHKTGAGQKVWAKTAVHDQRFARRIGGVRFVERERPGELHELAAAMTWKSPISWIPADGEKTIVYTGNQKPEDIKPVEKARILKEHLAELKKEDPGVIFGPDMDCGEDVMDLLSQDEEDHVSGLSESNGGFSIDKNGFTAYGMDVALEALAKQVGWKTLEGMTAAIQGFGSVGAHIAKRLFEDRKIIIRAANNRYGTWVATTEKGLDASQLFEAWDQGGDKAFQNVSPRQPYAAEFVQNVDAIWKEKVDIFVPAARTDVLATLEEKKDAFDVQQFWENTGVRLILEGANEPLTDKAEAFLESKDVLVIPGFLINCGGLIGCWVDWIYRRELKEKEKREHYAKEAWRYIEKVIRNNVATVMTPRNERNEKVGLREVARELAKKRREELEARFEGYERSRSGPDPDGRGFARLCMDELLAVEAEDVSR